MAFAKTKTKMRKIIISVWVLILAAFAYYLISNGIQLRLSEIPLMLHAKIESYGNFGIAMFIFFTSIRPILLMPTSAFIILGGLVFGPVGILYSLIGELIASTLAFCVARYLGHDFIEAHTGERFKDFEHKLEKHSFRSIILLRLMILVPNDLINYAAGASDLPYARFLLASILGLIPTIFMYNFTAEGINDIRYLLIPAGVVSLAVVFGKTIRYHYKRHKENHLQVVAELGETKI